MSREVDHLRLRLRAIIAAADGIAIQAEDLHGLGFERTVARTGNGGGPVLAEDGTPPGVSTHGHPYARDLWADLEKSLRRIETTIVARHREVANLLSRGGPIADESRGSLISRREFKDRLEIKDRNMGRGDYVPARMLDQPPYPGTTS